MMDRRRGILVCVLLGLVICIGIALTSGIDSVELQQGRLLADSGSSSGQGQGWQRETPRSFVLPTFDVFKILIPLCLTAVVISAFMSIRDKQVRSHLLFTLFALGVLILVMVVSPLLKPHVQEEPELTVDETASSEILESPGTRPDVLYVEPEGTRGESRWSLIATAALAAVLVGLTAAPLTLLILRRRRRRSLADQEAEEILAIAGDAVRELEEGAEPVGVVQRCYTRMLRALSDQSGVNPTFRTPREFASAMREVGLHSEGVDALTEMFELVRYGGRDDAPLAARAHGCLTALRLSHEAS